MTEQPINQRDVLIDAITDEVLRIEEDTLHSYKGHFNAGALWSVVHIVLGLPAAVLAAWASIEAFSSNTQLTALLAMIAAGLSTTSTFLNPSKKSTEHKNSGRELNALNNKARRFRKIELLSLQTDIAQEQLEVLATHRDELNSISPDIPRYAYEKAKIDIDSGRAKYHVDKEMK